MQTRLSKKVQTLKDALVINHKVKISVAHLKIRVGFKCLLVSFLDLFLLFADLDELNPAPFSHVETNFNLESPLDPSQRHKQLVPLLNIVTENIDNIVLVLDDGPILTGTERGQE